MPPTPQAAAPSFNTTNPADPIFAGLTPAQLARVVNWFATPIDLDLRRTPGRPEVVTADDLPGTAHLLRVPNGTPGITNLTVEVNGQRAGNVHLGDGESRTLDIAAHLRPGDDNTVTLTATGKPDGSAVVIIHD